MLVKRQLSENTEEKNVGLPGVHGHRNLVAFTGDLWNNMEVLAGKDSFYEQSCCVRVSGNVNRCFRVDIKGDKCCNTNAAIRVVAIHYRFFYCSYLHFLANSV